jgi:hypothetical protein
VEGDDDRVTFYCCDGFEHETQNTDDVLGDVDLDDILADVDLDEDDVDEDDVDEDDVDEEDARHISIIPTGKPAQQ